ncbi:uncharacterized protein LOC111229378 isoform X3 [Seriola dumerili]|uniref:uncharacterized protein LOC111229378 isoform X3 n=1 Tax=Seriola dumerili TaxID=41447 RepID=UPI000BBEEF25|nr:uncharacterized protein LOC111229378 isoform X3 [Seriola dumerili]
MAKGKGKISSSDGVAPTQLRSLRSRKRECPSDEVPQTDSAQATLHQQCDPDDERGPSTVNTERTKTRDTTDPYGSGSLDYVSDSQLNTIVLIEEVVMEEADPGSSDCHEDATDLICGLIRELSSLNRKVMATHRELENLRRGSKTPRSSNR